MVESADVWSGSDLGRVGTSDMKRAARLLGQRPEGLEGGRARSSHDGLCRCMCIGSRGPSNYRGSKRRGKMYMRRAKGWLERAETCINSLAFPGSVTSSSSVYKLPSRKKKYSQTIELTG